MTENATLKTVIVVDDTKFISSLNRAKNSAKNFASETRNAFSSVGQNLFAGLIGVGFIESLRVAGERLDETVASAKNLGIAANQFQALSYAAKQSNVDVGTLKSGLEKLRFSIAAAKPGDMLAGVSAAKLKAMDLGEAYLEISKSIASMTGEYDKAAAAREAFGKAGSDQLGIIKNNPEDAIKEFKAAGLGISNEDVAKFEAFDQKSKLLAETIQQKLTKAFVELTPTLNTAMKGLEVGISVLNKSAAGWGLLGQVISDTATKAKNSTGTWDELENKRRQIMMDQSITDTNVFNKQNIGNFTNTRSSESQIPNFTSGSQITDLEKTTPSIISLGSAAASAAASLNSISQNKLQDILGISQDSGKSYLASILTPLQQVQDDEFTRIATELRNNVASGTQGFGTNNSTKIEELQAIANSYSGENNQGMLAAVQELKAATTNLNKSQEVTVIVQVKDNEFISAVVDSTQFNTKAAQAAVAAASREAQATGF